MSHTPPLLLEPTSLVNESKEIADKIDQDLVPLLDDSLRTLASAAIKLPDKMKRGEANIKARKYLSEHPDATARELAAAVGCSLGLISKLPVWKLFQEQRDKGRKPKGRRAISLTNSMLNNMDQKRRMGQRISTSPKEDGDEQLARLTAEQNPGSKPRPLDGNPPLLLPHLIKATKRT